MRLPMQARLRMDSFPALSLHCRRGAGMMVSNPLPAITFAATGGGVAAPAG